MSDSANLSSSTLLVILGASEFPKFPEDLSSPAFKQAAKDVFLYFLDPDGYGLDSDNAISLFDYTLDPLATLERCKQFVRERISTLQAKNVVASDLIVYYIGHSAPDESDELFLAIRVSDEKNRGASGIRIRSLGAAVRDVANWLRTTLIFDSCFAAAAAPLLQSPPGEVLAKGIEQAGFPPRGISLLAAASRNATTAVTPEKDTTMFSKGLLRVLKHGDSRYPRDQLTLSEVHWLLSQRVKELFGDRAVQPELHSPRQAQGPVADVPLYPNRAILNARRIAQAVAEQQQREAADKQRAKEPFEKVDRERAAADAARQRELAEAEDKRKKLEEELRAETLNKVRKPELASADGMSAARAEAEAPLTHDLNPDLLDAWLQTKIDELETERLRRTGELEEMKANKAEALRQATNLQENITYDEKQGRSARSLQGLYDYLASLYETANTLTPKIHSARAIVAELEARVEVYRSCLTGGIGNEILALKQAKFPWGFGGG